MQQDPTEYGEIINSLGQTITFYEHPTKGDEYPVICVCHELQLAEASDFWETTDMEEPHGEYTPAFVNGELVYGPNI